MQFSVMLQEARLESAGESSPICKFYFLCVCNYEISIKTREQETDIIFLISFLVVSCGDETPEEKCGW